MNNFEMAYNYQKKLTEINDSLFHQKHDDKLMLLEIKREADEKEAKILIFKQQAQLQVEKQTQQEIWLLLAIVIILFLVLIGLLVIKNLKKTNETLSLLSSQKQEIENQNEKLYDLNVEKDGLIGVVAHDLRSPLNRIKGLMVLFRMDGELTESQKDYIKMVEKACESGIALIKDLLLINDAENEKNNLVIKKILLDEFLADIIHVHRVYAQKKQINILFIKHINPIELETETNFLERILDNLLSNAIKFSFPNSTVYINLAEENNQISISIRDEGQGMSEIDKTKIFKKFQKLSAQPTAGEDSTGLGLSIVKALVEQLKGTIEVQSELGKGTEFIIKFIKN
jgi:signal transduction histidine kinase